MKLFFLSLISLFTVSAVQANVIIPSMITWNGVDSIFGWWLILFGFVIECVCFYQFLNKSIGQTIILSAFINLFSSLIGAISGLLTDFLFLGALMPRGLNFDVFAIGPIPGWNVVYGVLLFVGSVFFNVLIEGGIIKFFVPKISVKNMFFWLVIANALSVGIGIGGVGMRWYNEGISPWAKSAQERKELFEKKYKVSYKKLKGGGVLTKVRKRK